MRAVSEWAKIVRNAALSAARSAPRLELIADNVARDLLARNEHFGDEMPVNRRRDCRRQIFVEGWEETAKVFRYDDASLMARRVSCVVVCKTLEEWSIPSWIIEELKKKFSK